jgi:hypothetical protein
MQAELVFSCSAKNGGCFKFCSWTFVKIAHLHISCIATTQQFSWSFVTRYFIRWWSDTVFGFCQCTHAVFIPIAISSCSASGVCSARGGTSMSEMTRSALLMTPRPALLSCDRDDNVHTPRRVFSRLSSSTPILRVHPQPAPQADGCGWHFHVRYLNHLRVHSLASHCCNARGPSNSIPRHITG